MQGDAAIEVAGEVGERVAASRQGDRIVAPEFDGSASQARALGRLPLGIDRPSIDLAPEITPRRGPIGRSEIRIELDRFFKQQQRGVDGLPGSPLQVG